MQGFVTDESGFDPQEGPVLVVHGDGDPAFGDSKLMQQHNMDMEQLFDIWIDHVNKTGVKTIQSLIVDDRVFDRQLIHAGWPSDQLHMWYCAQVAGLNFNDNCLDVYVEPTQRGQTPRIHTLPSAPFLSPLNRAVTGKSDTFWISRKPLTNELTYWGQVKHYRDTPVRVTIHN